MDANGLRRCEESYCIFCGIFESSSSNDKQTLLKRCSRCKTAKYCCVEHQRSDFKVHKLYCKPIAQAKAALVTIGNIDVARNIYMLTRTKQQDQQIIAYMKAREKIADCMVGMAFHSSVPYSKVGYIYETVLDVLLDMFRTDQVHMGLPERLATILLLLGFDQYCEAFYRVILDGAHFMKIDSEGTELGCEIWSKPDFLRRVHQFWMEGRAEPLANILSNMPPFEAVVFLLIEQRMVDRNNVNGMQLSFQVPALEKKLSPGLVSWMRETYNQKLVAVDKQIADDLYKQSPNKTPIEYWLLLKICSAI